MMQAGARLGRFELLEILGDGGFATVYRAWDPSLGREVALKALHPHLAAQPEVVRRFVAEAQALARLTHPHIVTVYDVGSEGEHPFFTMELLRGPTLAQAVPSPGGLAWEQTLTILTGLASALDYLHAAGLIHRDIKAANVILTGIRPVLMDFGIVRAMDEVHHTRTGAALGTPEAMAPEQVRGEDVGPAADIYALGVMAYQLLAGAPPFTGETAYVLHAHAYVPPPPLEEQRTGLPGHVYAAVASALAKDPAQRPHSAGEFIRMLGGGVAIKPAASAPAAARRSGRLLAVAGGLLLLVVAVAGGAALLLGRGGGEASTMTAAANEEPAGGASASLPAGAVGGTRTPAGGAPAQPTRPPTAAPPPTPSPAPTRPPLLRPGEVRPVDLVHDFIIPSSMLAPCTPGPRPAGITLRLRVTQVEVERNGRLKVSYEAEALAVPGQTCVITYFRDGPGTLLVTVKDGAAREWKPIEGTGLAVLPEGGVDLYGRRELGLLWFEVDLSVDQVWFVQLLITVESGEPKVTGDVHRLQLLP